MNNKHEPKTKRKRKPGSEQAIARKQRRQINDHVDRLRANGYLVDHPNFSYMDPRSLSKYCDCPLCDSGAILIEQHGDGWQLSQAAVESSDYCYPTEIFRNYQAEEDLARANMQVCTLCLGITMFTQQTSIPFGRLISDKPSACDCGELHDDMDLHQQINKMLELKSGC